MALQRIISCFCSHPYSKHLLGFLMWSGWISYMSSSRVFLFSLISFLLFCILKGIFLLYLLGFFFRRSSKSFLSSKNQRSSLFGDRLQCQVIYTFLRRQRPHPLLSGTHRLGCSLLCDSSCVCDAAVCCSWCTKASSATQMHGCKPHVCVMEHLSTGSLKQDGWLFCVCHGEAALYGSASMAMVFETLLDAPRFQLSPEYYV